MRHTLLPALAAVLLLAGCVLETPERARCDDIGGTGHCPVGQRCGADGTCSVAATACEQIECGATTCEGNTLRKCVVSGSCSTLQTETCDTNAQTCDVASQSCQCVDAQGCPGTGTMCSTDRTAIIACGSVNGCPYRTGDGNPQSCATGEVCIEDYPSARCDCPVQQVALNQGCSSEGQTACAGETLLTCHKVGTHCFQWTVARDCTVDGLHCGVDVTAACLCPAPAAPGTTLLADSGSPFDAAVKPNGASPALCRFKTLSAAIGAAQAGFTVIADSTSVVPFQEPAFTIKGGVAVVGDQSSPVVQPGNVVVELTGPGTQGIVLEANASLSGVTIRRASGAAAATGLEIAGASPAGGLSLADVVVDKGATTDVFSRGVVVSGTGAVSMQRLTVRDASLAGLEVHRAAVGESVSLSDSTLSGNATGVKLLLGSLEMTGCTIRSSGSDGVVADGGAVGTTRLTMSGGAVVRNGGTGVVASLNDSLRLSAVRICANTGAPRVLAAGTRRAGGLYLLGDVPTDLLFKGNLIHHNSGDQVLVGASGASRWNLATSGCASGEANAFAGYQGSTGDGGVGVAAVSAKVDAWWNAWSTTSLPAINVDFVALGTGAEVNARGSGAEYCEPPGLVESDCPP